MMSDNNQIDKTITKVIEYIDWYKAYDDSDDEGKRTLVLKYPNEISSLLVEVKTKVETYFKEVQNHIEDNLEKSIKNDIKIQYINECLPDVFGQLTMWDPQTLLNKNDNIKKIMNSYGSEWMMNLISLKDNTSCIMYSDDNVKTNLEGFLDCSIGNGCLLLKPAMLRKEIMKKALQSKNIVKK